METLYYNGNIITMEDGAEPEAVLVKDGFISFVGNLDEAKKNAGKNAELVDLQGKCLLPGFIDPHSHIFMNGQMSVCARLNECTSNEEIIAVLKKYLKENNPGAKGVVIGFGYDHNILDGGGQPDKRVLDQVSTDIPIMIMHISGHLGCVNSKMLELAGITAETPNPQGGVIGRLENGEPSGYLEEAATALAQAIMKKRIKINLSMIRRVLNDMQKIYIENGVTTAQDGATSKSDLMALKLASKLGLLKIDIVSYPLMSAGGTELLHKNSKLCRNYKKHLKIGGYKLLLDGSPQGRSRLLRLSMAER